MKLASFTLIVSYSQIAVFDSALAHPFSMWTQRHVDQGFAWRNGSASFRTVENSGPHVIEVMATSEDPDLSPEAARIIEVPFEIRATGSVEIASITQRFSAEAPPSLHSLRFECFLARTAVQPMVKLFFIKNNNPTFRVLRADEALNLAGELVTSASPA
jgi:hypothetical protein